MAQVVGIHGIAQQQLDELSLANDWELALHGALKKVPVDASSVALSVAFFGNLYLTAADEGLVAMSGVSSGYALEPDDVDYLSEIVDDEQISAEVATAPPGMGGPAVPTPLRPFIGWVGFRFGAAAPLLLVGELKQVRRYQQDGEFADSVRTIVKQRLDQGCRVLIGHSLGSIVALDVLNTGYSCDVKTLITLGSPLALKPVRARLFSGGGWPEGLEKWVDVRDPADPVSCAGGYMRDIWPGVTSREVNNGNEPHSSVRYLRKKVVGQEVAKGLNMPPESLLNQSTEESM